MTKLFSWLKAELGFLVLLAVAGVGAWLYVDGQRARADAADAVARAEKICARAGSDWSATEKATRGALCLAKVRDLADFRTAAADESARAMAAAMAAAQDRTLKDNQAARAAAEAARAAATRMEAADAEAERRNLVDREWFAAVNGVAGLRPPSR